MLECFHGLLPLISMGYKVQSVPSGHTATAVALTIVLCRFWPHARWAFLVLLAMAVMQRIVDAHHYPSDCLWGAALACTFAGVCYHPRLLGRYFNRLESGVARKKHTSNILAGPLAKAGS